MTDMTAGQSSGQQVSESAAAGAGMEPAFFAAVQRDNAEIAACEETVRQRQAVAQQRRDTVMARKKTLQEAQEAVRRQRQAVTAAHQPERDLENLERSPQPAFRQIATFAGFTLFEDKIQQKGRAFAIPIDTVSVSVGIRGEIYTTTQVSGGGSRPTLTRVTAGALLGGGVGAAIGMAAQKKQPVETVTTTHDEREGILIVQGDGVECTSTFPVAQEADAREFAGKIYDAKAGYAQARNRLQSERRTREARLAALRDDVERAQPVIRKEEEALASLQESVEAQQTALKSAKDAVAQARQEVSAAQKTVTEAKSALKTTVGTASKAQQKAYREWVKSERASGASLPVAPSGMAWKVGFAVVAVVVVALIALAVLL